jgi:hypothetical protein
MHKVAVNAYRRAVPDVDELKIGPTDPGACPVTQKHHFVRDWNAAPDGDHGLRKSLALVVSGLYQLAARPGLLVRGLD